MKGPQRGETNTAWGPSGCCPSYSRGNRHPSLPPGPPISIFLWPNPTGGQRPGGLVAAGHRDRQNRWRGSILSWVNPQIHSLNLELLLFYLYHNNMTVLVVNSVVRSKMWNSEHSEFCDGTTQHQQWSHCFLHQTIVSFLKEHCIAKAMSGRNRRKMKWGNVS